MNKKLMWMLPLFLLYAQCCCAVPFTTDEIDAKLSELKPLPKVHYFWPLRSTFWKKLNERRLYELARITHSMCISGEWTTLEQIDKCVYTCCRLNKTSPMIKASMAVNFSPWHRKFGKDLPPTDRGATYFEEISYFEQRAELVKKWITMCNEKYNCDVNVSAIAFDCERFGAKKGNKQWNDAVREALDAIHIKAAAVFPNAKMIWYGRGMQYDPRQKDWEPTRYWTGEEIKAPLTCALYTVPETERMRETFRRTVQLAESKGIYEVVPHVALAAGYQSKMGGGHYWRKDWPYDLKYSYTIGMELNTQWVAGMAEELSIYNHAKCVLFYPAPFDDTTPDWARHFIAYVRGANNIKILEDLVDK